MPVIHDVPLQDGVVVFVCEYERPMSQRRRIEALALPCRQTDTSRDGTLGDIRRPKVHE
jgi:hypothetical protein